MRRAEQIHSPYAGLFRPRVNCRSKFRLKIGKGELKETPIQSEKLHANGRDAEKACGTPVLDEQECNEA